MNKYYPVIREQPPHAHMFIHNLLPELLTDCLPSILYTSTHLHGLEGPNPKDKERRGAKKTFTWFAPLLAINNRVRVDPIHSLAGRRWNPKNKHISSPLELSLSLSLSYETRHLGFISCYPLSLKEWISSSWFSTTNLWMFNIHWSFFSCIQYLYTSTSERHPLYSPPELPCARPCSPPPKIIKPVCVKRYFWRPTDRRQWRKSLGYTSPQ